MAPHRHELTDEEWAIASPSQEGAPQSRSPRQKEHLRLLGLIKQPRLESGDIYGYHKITSDLRDLGESCDTYRIYRRRSGAMVRQRL